MLQFLSGETRAFAKRAFLLLIPAVVPTDKPADVNMPLNVPGGTTITLYQDNTGKGKPLEGPTLRTRLEPHRHLVATAARGA